MAMVIVWKCNVWTEHGTICSSIAQIAPTPKFGEEKNKHVQS